MLTKIHLPTPNLVSSIKKFSNLSITPGNSDIGGLSMNRLLDVWKTLLSFSINTFRPILSHKI